MEVGKIRKFFVISLRESPSDDLRVARRKKARQSKPMAPAPAAWRRGNTPVESYRPHSRPFGPHRFERNRCGWAFRGRRSITRAAPVDSLPPLAAFVKSSAV